MLSRFYVLAEQTYKHALLNTLATCLTFTTSESDRNSITTVRGSLVRQNGIVDCRNGVSWGFTDSAFVFDLVAAFDFGLTAGFGLANVKPAELVEALFCLMVVDFKVDLGGGDVVWFVFVLAV